MALFYQCPDCGFKQKSEAKKRIKCHRCGRSYQPSKAKKFKKKKGEEGKEGFFKYRKDD